MSPFVSNLPNDSSIVTEQHTTNGCCEGNEPCKLASLRFFDGVKVVERGLLRVDMFEMVGASLLVNLVNDAHLAIRNTDVEVEGSSVVGVWIFKF